MELLDPVERRPHRRVVAEDLDRPDDLPGVVAQGRHAHEHRHAVPVGVMQVDLLLARLAVGHRLRERALAVAQHPPGLVHVHQQVVEARPPHHLLLPQAGHPLGAPVPVLDPALAVDHVDAVVQAVEDDLEVGRDRRGISRHLGFLRLVAALSPGVYPSRPRSRSYSFGTGFRCHSALMPSSNIV